MSRKSELLSTIAPPTPPRDNQHAEHGKTAPRKFRGVPPPPGFDFDTLADGTLLTEYETAQVLRGSMATLQAWRARRADALPWVEIAEGRIRYKAADIRAFMARPRTRKYPTPPRRPRRADKRVAELTS